MPELAAVVELLPAVGAGVECAPELASVVESVPEVAAVVESVPEFEVAADHGVVPDHDGGVGGASRRRTVVLAGRG